MRKLLCPALLTALFFATGSIARAEQASQSIVFVCEHGSVKSLIAASFFNRLAAEQKVAYRAVARGTEPQDAVPPAVSSNLKKDGFSVESFKPQALTKQDADQASAIVAFCEIPKELLGPAKVSSWLDVPPASIDYEKAKAVMLPRIEAMVAELKLK
jgi:hypothetical protein